MVLPALNLSTLDAGLQHFSVSPSPRPELEKNQKYILIYLLFKILKDGDLTVGAWTKTRELLSKYLPRMFEAIDLAPGHYRLVLKTGFDASQHTIFCQRTGMKSKTASGKLSDAINITVAGKLLTSPSPSPKSKPQIQSLSTKYRQQKHVVHCLFNSIFL